MAILFAAIVVGVAMWLVLNRTRLGMLIRAGVDDREMLAASGVRIQYVFLAVFGFRRGSGGHGWASSAAPSSRCRRARTRGSCSPRWSW
jgi:branched-chain amino acid transport system permease protein